MPRCPVVSVVVSAYNSAPFIRAAVQSVLDQTFADLEVIVVDDGSTDGTADQLLSFDDRRFQIVRQENQGSAGAANTGIRLSRGTHVGFLDGDDVWRKTKLARHVDFLDRHPNLDVTFSWSRLMDESGRELRLHTRHWRGPISAEQLFVDFVPANGSSAVFRRAALEKSGGLDPDLPLYCDMDLFLRVALLRPGNACAIDEELTLYRRRRGQLSRNYPAMQLEWERMIRKLEGLAPALAERSKRRARSNMSRYFGFLAHESYNEPEALRWLWRAYRYCPSGFLTDIRNWQVCVAALAGLILPRGVQQRLERMARMG